MDLVVRYRAWIVMGVLLVAVVLATILEGGRNNANVGIGRPHVRFGAALRPPATATDFVFTNGWMASSGKQSIAVYAGSERADRGRGLLLITRSGGGQRLARVVVGASGGLTLLRPATPANEAQAQTETLHFVTANGNTGTLDLSGDSVKLGS